MAEIGHEAIKKTMHCIFLRNKNQQATNGGFKSLVCFRWNFIKHHVISFTNCFQIDLLNNKTQYKVHLFLL